MTALLLGLVCAALIGTANFFGGLVSKKDSSLTITFVGQLTTVPIVALLLLAVPASDVQLSDIGWGVVAGVIQIFGLRLIWQAMSVGKMGLLAAINATMCAVVPAAWAVGRGEHFGVAAAFGAALAFTAIVLIMQSPGDVAAVVHHRKQALKAVASGTLFGLAFIAIAIPSKSASVAPLLVARISGAVVAGGLIALLGGRFWLSKDNKLGLLPGLFGVMSLIGFVAAAHLHHVATVSILQALAPLFTTVLAFAILRQRLRPIQRFGLFLALFATGLLVIR